MTTRRPQVPDVFLGMDAVAASAMTPAELRGPTVHRLVRGVYCPATVRHTHEHRCRAVAMVAPPGAVVSASSALTVRGVALRNPNDPVDVVVAPDQRFVLGRDVIVRRRELRLDEWTPWVGGRLATPTRAALDMLLGVPVLESVPLLDVVLRSGLVSLDRLAAEVRGRSDRGIVLARQAVELADDRAESHPESWVRVVLGLAGLSPDPQFTVRDARGFVGRVDLAFVRERVAIEYEGGHHRDEGWVVRDRRRLDRLRQAGWTVVFVTKADLHRPPGALVARVREALAVASAA